MTDKKNNISKRILVAPLDWGLGHATRCIPLIRRLLADENQVFLAGSGASGHLLRSEFPQLPYAEIPSHTVHYAQSRNAFHWSILKQIPALMKQVGAERKWLGQYLSTQPIDTVLSDNRYGLHHPTTHNILITHQLGLKSGLYKWMDRMLQRMLYRLLKNFHEVWVPDNKDEPWLSGELGHPKYTPPCPIKYIGPLSRFTATNRNQIPNKITILLSGPEPQRTLLEEKCMHELAKWKGPVTMIRGLPLGGKQINAPAHWKVVDHLSIDPLQQEIEEAEHFIARCGYSTIMDLYVLNKRAILIPTPGQPEQEYLGRWINEQSLFQIQDQQQHLLREIDKFDHQ